MMSRWESIKVAQDEEHKPNHRYVFTKGGDTPIDYYVARCSCGWKANPRSEAATNNAFERHLRSINPPQASPPKEDAFIPQPNKRWGPRPASTAKVRKAIFGIGIPGSGKSTFLKPLAEHMGAEYVSSDGLRKEITGDEADISRDAEVWPLMYQRVHDALDNNGTVVIDATGTHGDKRREFVSHIRQKADEVHGVYFDTPLSTALERNRNRDRFVPEHVIHKMHQSLQDDPPTEADGFDTITTMPAPKTAAGMENDERTNKGESPLAQGPTGRPKTVEHTVHCRNCGMVLSPIFDSGGVRYHCPNCGWNDENRERKRHASKLPDDVAEAFKAVGQQQRGDAEESMRNLQGVMGGGVLPFVVEHVGDLTHRMTHMADFSTFPELVDEKVHKTLRTLKSPYGFEKEHNENVQSNADYDGRNTQDIHDQVNHHLEEYARHHSALPVYNRPQWLGQQAAVAIGKKDWNGAIGHLEELQGMVQDYDEFESKALSFERNEDGSLKRYEPPKVASSVILGEIIEEEEMSDTPLRLELVCGHSGDHLKTAGHLGYWAGPDDGHWAHPGHERFEQECVERGITASVVPTLEDGVWHSAAYAYFYPNQIDDVVAAVEAAGHPGDILDIQGDLTFDENVEVVAAAKVHGWTIEDWRPQQVEPEPAPVPEPVVVVQPAPVVASSSEGDLLDKIAALLREMPTPQVHVHLPKVAAVTKRIERDEEGNITGIVEETQEEPVEVELEGDTTDAV